MEGFGEVVVGAVIQAGDLVVERITGRDNNDPVPLFVLTEEFQQLQTAAPGQVDVENDTIVLKILNFFKGLLKGRRLFAKEVFFAKIARDAGEEAAFVFDD